MIIHFHRYGVPPGEESYSNWQEVSERLDAPIWLGESGENRMEWYSAMFPLASRLGIGSNFWTWKRMGLNPAPAIIRQPSGWEKIIGFTRGGPRPSYAESAHIFDAYLENILIENCDVNADVADALFRRKSALLMATDFDNGPDGCSGLRHGRSIIPYRMDSGMCIRTRTGCVFTHGPGFDSGWDKLCLELAPGEWAMYSLHEVKDGITVRLSGEAVEGAEISVSLSGGTSVGVISVNGVFNDMPVGTVYADGDIRVRVKCTSGTVNLHVVALQKLRTTRT